MKITGVFICFAILSGPITVAFPVVQNLAVKTHDVIRESQSLLNDSQVYIQELHTVLTSDELSSTTAARIPALPDIEQSTSMSRINELTQILRRTKLNITLLINAGRILDRSKILNLRSFEALISNLGNLRTLILNLTQSVEESFTSEQRYLERDLKVVDNMLYFEADDELHDTDIPTDSKQTNLVEMVIIGQLKGQLESLIPRLISYLL